MKKRRIKVNDKMQSGYEYKLTEKAGNNFHRDFNPDLTPRKMLELGVFCGKYMTDCRAEFPCSWFENAKLAPKDKNPSLNFFEVEASMPLSHWQRKGWIYEEDPRGWFQWYCRYYMGRRMRKDRWQIKRWKGIKRHVGAIKKNCKKGDWECRPKQRQVLLHWAYDGRKY